MREYGRSPIPVFRTRSCAFSPCSHVKHLRKTSEAGRLELEGDLPLLLQQGNGGQELVPRNLVFVCEGERSFPWTCSQFMMIFKGNALTDKKRNWVKSIRVSSE